MRSVVGVTGVVVVVGANMKIKNNITLHFCIALVVLMWCSGGLQAQPAENPFPSFGSGPIQVRVYTDYFCPPCRAMEPSIDPILKDLLSKNKITLTLVDVPFNRLTPLYARYFLYALKAKNDVKHAFHVRNVLQDAAAADRIATEEDFKKLYAEKLIIYEVFDTSVLFARLNIMIKEDKIRQTPTFIIVRNGDTEKIEGKSDIIEALKLLQ